MSTVASQTMKLLANGKHTKEVVELTSLSKALGVALISAREARGKEAHFASDAR